MIDGIIDGNGTSRKVFANFPATYEEFRMQAASGTLFMDILFNAAGWQQQPDFLNKRNLIQDITATMLGLDSGAVPDDALRVLGRFHSGIGNEYIWDYYGPVIEPTPSGSTEATQQLGPVPQLVYVNYSDKVAWDDLLQKYYLVNPESFLLPGIPIEDMQNEAVNQINNTLQDKYIQSSDISEFKDVHLFRYSEPDGNKYAVVLHADQIVPMENTKFLGYVNSPDPAAYPPEEPDGCTYNFIGQLGAFTRTITGNYTGTGERTRSITFPVLPQFLFIYTSSINLGQGLYWAIWSPYMERSAPNVSGQDFISTSFSTKGTTLTITGSSSGLGDEADAILALNTKDQKYYYFAVLG